MTRKIEEVTVKGDRFFNTFNFEITDEKGNIYYPKMVTVVKEQIALDGHGGQEVVWQDASIKEIRIKF